MKKYVVETFYTCTFKTVHTLNNLDDTELSKIEDAFYPEKEQMMDLLHYLAYCQFTPEEMSTSKALKLIDRNGLYDEAI